MLNILWLSLIEVRQSIRATAPYKISGCGREIAGMYLLIIAPLSLSLTVV
jgi:hypothetical protein